MRTTCSSGSCSTRRVRAFCGVRSQFQTGESWFATYCRSASASTKTSGGNEKGVKVGIFARSDSARRTV